MSEEQKEESGKILDKVLCIIIGGAIGSVVGASIAPKKGKETRGKIFSIFHKLTHILRKKE